MCLSPTPDAHPRGPPSPPPPLPTSCVFFCIWGSSFFLRYPTAFPRRWRDGSGTESPTDAPLPPPPHWCGSRVPSDSPADAPMPTRAPLTPHRTAEPIQFPILAHALRWPMLGRHMQPVQVPLQGPALPANPQSPCGDSCVVRAMGSYCFLISPLSRFQSCFDDSHHQWTKADAREQTGCFDNKSFRKHTTCKTTLPWVRH